MELNPGQRAAVYTRGKDLLVSASAGSGKTFSLCLRVLEQLKRKDRPASLDKMLIVTFTKASAADVRKKLTKLLKEAIEKEEDSGIRTYLKKQKNLLPGARIGTIDSFYYEVVSTHFDELGISPKIRISDEAELRSLKRRLMEKALEEVGKGEHREALERLLGNLSSDYGERDLPEKLIDLYKETENLPEGKDCLLYAENEQRRASEMPFSRSAYGKVLTDKNKETLTFFINTYRWYLGLFEGDEKFDKKQGEVLTKELYWLERSYELAEEPESQERFLKDFNTVSRLLLPKGEEQAYFKTVRTYAKKYLSSREERYADTDFSRASAFYSQSADLTHCLYALFSLYGDLLRERKRRTGTAEFQDVARMTYNLLCKEGKPSAIAEKMAEEIDELYIDEYQDVNELQDRIFLSLSRSNRFVVGDIKQSIYGFRGACPQIFKELRESYPDNDLPGEIKGKIFLRENFRSTRQVLEFTNACIGSLMAQSTDMLYTEEDNLKPGILREGQLPVICYVDPKNEKWGKEEKPEAAYLAQSLKRLIREGTQAEDIAVLVRNNTPIPDIQRALEKAGIATETTFVKNFFENPEILLMRSLIECIDNPTADISLAGAMRSPVFGFTLDELAKIRQEGEGESLFSALNDYTAKTGNPRCRRLLSFIADYRRKAQEYPADTLIFKMTDELMLLPLLTADKDGEEAERIKENILAFYDMVRAAAATGQKDLGRMLKKISDMAEDDKMKVESAPETGRNKVRIMTVHASKGLEFEVCWLYGANIPMRKGDGAFSRERGIAFGLQDKEVPWLQNITPVGLAQKVANAEKTVNEEMRLLYVALTRAVSKLYISCTASKSLLDTCKEMENYPGLHRYLLEKNACYIKWIKMALGKKQGLYREYVNDLPFESPEETEEEKAIGCKEEPTEDSPEFVKEYEACREKIKERMRFVYPYSASVELPAKKAVSVLSPTVLDEEEELLLPELSVKNGLQPAFYAQRQGNRTYSGADFARRGTATHAFMQFCDFSRLESEGFESEALRLVRERFLSETMMRLVEKRAVESFLRSDLYAALKKARRVYREQRFMISLPAENFTSSKENKKALEGEQLLVQGVIDCFFEDVQGNIILFDYKTDRFSVEERKNPEECQRLLKERHSLQLGYYREAVKRMLGREVGQCYIYSFSLGRAIEV